LYRFKDYLKLKETNSLLVTKKEDKYSQSLKTLELYSFPEGLLTTSNFFLLKNNQTAGYLAIDTDDKNLNYENAFAVTTNPLMNFACPRSLFRIEKHGSSGEAELVNYGDKIYICSHPDIFSSPLYLSSSLITPQSYSRFSRNQEVLMSSQKNYNGAWVIEYPDNTLRYSMEGKPVSLKEGFIIKHCGTGRLLASDHVDYFNDYGHEYEVCCNNFLTNNKYHTLVAEKEGKLKLDTKTRTEKNQNIWTVVDQY
jgi:hypothetical protein